MVVGSGRQRRYYALAVAEAGAAEMIRRTTTDHDCRTVAVVLVVAELRGRLLGSSATYYSSTTPVVLLASKYSSS